MWGLLSLGAFLLWVFYKYATWTFDRFKGTNVPYMKPVALIGNSLKFLLKQEDMIESIGKPYTKFPRARFVGIFQMRLPSIMIRDPELIRQVAVKDFDSFTNHRPFVDPALEPLFGSSLFLLKDQKWRDMRSTLSPAFTGSKMRLMYEFIIECAEQLTDHSHEEVEKKGTLDLEVKDLVTKYANDVIASSASSAFGIKVDTLKNPDNIFYKMGRKVSNFSGFWVSLKFFAFLLIPHIMRVLRITLLDQDCGKFFRTLVHDTMDEREKKGIVRPDMINLLMQAKIGGLKHEVDVDESSGFATVTESSITKSSTHKRVWSDDEITGQAMIFFLAGFESISTSICFVAYELAINPDVQKTLQDEIDAVCVELEQSNQKLVDYERLHKMKYLDMVISGEKGEALMIPIYNIHHDEQYYENPHKFDPDRFSEENKQNIKPFTYMPFGVGPRNCIGSRFALMEMKALLFNILKEFDIVPSEKTQIPLKLSRNSIQMRPEKGFWMKLKPRKMRN
ncbi:cytochrome P450 9e2-like [Ctenocephalides felis]|uniref:cytochrome P450 9e2-like n=1 Tax=Ctenocephalides felis TaxID=7515 RepID=UPI000E6E24C0|nr:cytochrome P450 9e2-like [Ctenocephalides felis]